MIKHMHERGCYQSDIAEAVGVSEKTIRRALKRGGAPARRRSGVRTSKLDAYKATIDGLLSEQVWNAEVIYAEIKVLGYTGGKSILREYIRPKRVLRKSKATVRFETAPGEQLQHDWAELIVTLGNEARKIFIAVNTLGYSRRFHVWAALKNDAEHTYESLVRSFEYFGGVSKEVWVDNQKAAVISHRPGGHVKFNPGFIALAGHYGFQPKACRPARPQTCRPARPQTKGKDERMVGYTKDHFFQRYRQFESLVHINQLLEQWLIGIADQRLHSTVKEVVSERFALEKPYLQALPYKRFDTSYRETRRVALDAYIEVRGNRYSVPASLCGQIVYIHLSLDEQLKVFDSPGDLVAEHLLKPAEQGWQVKPAHHRRLWQTCHEVQVRPLSVYQEVD